VAADEAYPKPAYTKSHDYVSQLERLRQMSSYHV